MPGPRLSLKHSPRPVVKAGLLSLRIDKTSSVPVYAQIADGIRALLRKSGLAPGTLLPAERVLCEQYDVSRMTLRQAFDALEREGLIETQRGRGTFVAPRRLAKRQQEMRSFTEEIRGRGGVPGSHLVSFETRPASAEAARFFADAGAGPVFFIRRLRYSGGDPLALETVEIPCRLCPGLDRYDLTRQSLYKTLEKEFGLELTNCVEEISAERPGRLEKRLLGSPPPLAVLIIKRRTYSSQIPVECGTTVYRGDAYSAIVHSVRARS